MAENVVFPCSRCSAPISLPADVGQLYVTCPNCGQVDRVPLFQKRHPLRSAILFVLLLILVTALCWTITVTIGGEVIRPDIDATLANMRVGADTTVLIRAPVPFVVSFRVSGTEVKKGGIRVGLSITKYYLWFFNYIRCLPDDHLPAALKWIWQY